MKACLLGRTKTGIGHLAPDPRAIGMAVAGEHHGQGVNQMIKLRRVSRGQSAAQDRADSLEGRLQAVEPQDECLIAGQAREPLAPILANRAVHLLLLEAAFQMSKEPDGDEFLVSELRLPVIAQALITGLGRSIVDAADEQVDFNQQVFHGKKILLILPLVCLFQLLIRIYVLNIAYAIDLLQKWSKAEFKVVQPGD